MTTSNSLYSGILNASQEISGQNTAGLLSTANNAAKGTVFAPVASNVSAPQQATIRSITPEETVSGQLNKLLAEDSQYIQLAKNNAAAEANKRGLLNTSLAAGTGQKAAIEAALPIAQQDATTYSTSGLSAQEANQDITKTGYQSALDLRNQSTLSAQQATQQSALSAQEANQQRTQTGVEAEYQKQLTNLQAEINSALSAQESAQKSGLQAEAAAQQEKINALNAEAARILSAQEAEQNRQLSEIQGQINSALSAQEAAQKSGLQAEAAAQQKQINELQARAERILSAQDAVQKRILSAQEAAQQNKLAAQQAKATAELQTALKQMDVNVDLEKLKQTDREAFTTSIAPIMQQVQAEISNIQRSPDSEMDVNAKLLAIHEQQALLRSSIAPIAQIYGFELTWNDSSLISDRETQVQQSNAAWWESQQGQEEAKKRQMKEPEPIIFA